MGSCTSNAPQTSELISHKYNSKHRRNILFFRPLDLTKLKYVLATDLDGTFLGTNQDIDNFNKIFLDDYSTSCVLVYITGRSPKKFNDALELFDNLLMPDILITQDGSTINWLNPELLKLTKKFDTELKPTIDTNGHITVFQDPDWQKLLSFKWNQGLMESINTEWKNDNMSEIKENRQEIENFRVYLYLKSDKAAKKFLNYADDVIKDHKHEAIEVCKSICEYRDGFYATMTPINSGKGNAIEYISSKLGIKIDHFIIAGDSGNDISMFNVQNINGIVVKNAKKDLQDFYQNNKNKLKLYLSNEDETMGVLEGFKHHLLKISVA